MRAFWELYHPRDECECEVRCCRLSSSATPGRSALNSYFPQPDSLQVPAGINHCCTRTCQAPSGRTPICPNTCLPV